MALQGASMQPVRLLYINRSVPFQMRTRYLSVIALVGVFGTLLSCLLMVMYYKILEGPENTQTVYSGLDGMISCDIDRSTVTYLIAAILTMVNIISAHALLEEVEPATQEHMPMLPVVRTSGGSARGGVTGGESPGAAQQQHLQQVVLFFMAVIMLSSLTHGLTSVTVIPFLVDRASFSQAQVALYGLGTTLLAVVPPAILTIFPHFKDRSVLACALVLQVLVAGIFSLGNDSSWWPVVTGGLLASHGFSFVFISSMHIYSLLVSSQENESTLLKIPTFCQAVGVGLGHLAGGMALFFWYRTPWILLAAGPSSAVFVMLVRPWYFVRLDPPYGVPWAIVESIKTTPQPHSVEIPMETSRK
mmetsp:Transcript_22395/g.31146  ORF Transcript_22395/g.31146 Transcript_22395/m.31146 type:complete len:360 (+) Transcript_22395:1-1080(+)